MGVSVLLGTSLGLLLELLDIDGLASSSGLLDGTVELSRQFSLSSSHLLHLTLLLGITSEILVLSGLLVALAQLLADVAIIKHINILSVSEVMHRDLLKNTLVLSTARHAAVLSVSTAVSATSTSSSAHVVAVVTVHVMSTNSTLVKMVLHVTTRSVAVAVGATSLTSIATSNHASALGLEVGAAVSTKVLSVATSPELEGAELSTELSAVLVALGMKTRTDVLQLASHATEAVKGTTLVSASTLDEVSVLVGTALPVTDNVTVHVAGTETTHTTDSTSAL